MAHSRKWLLPLLSFLLGAVDGAEAQVCNDFPGAGPTVGPGALVEQFVIPSAPNCLQAFHCFPAVLASTASALVDPECDPHSSTCAVRVTATVDARGSRQNYLFSPQRWTTADWKSEGGAAIGECGRIGGIILWDRLETWIDVPFRCAEPSALDDLAGTYQLVVNTCGVASACPETATLEVPVTQAGLEASICGVELPEIPPMDERNQCRSRPAEGAGLFGPSQSTVPGTNVTVRYRAGGVGGDGFPGTAAWRTTLGRFWTHDGAERIVDDPVEDPNVSHVWLLTAQGVFRKFTDRDGDGLYETVSPSDEHRVLTKTGNGWELTGLTGTVQSFDTQGRWTRTVDRNGNATVASYLAGRLDRIDFPDGRAEAFAYHPSGKLESVTEIGVDGATSRSWFYTWSGDDLERVDRPDGTAIRFVYEDTAHPGYMTQQILVGTDGMSERVQRAWEYDSEGNVEATWRGAAEKTHPEAVDLWQFAFDDPAEPSVTTVTDPLGQVTIYDYERDSMSEKPRVTSIDGECPSCGFSADTTLFYDDPENPLLPTTMIDGRGTVSSFTYDANGRMLSRTEAVGVPGLERTTEWRYDDPAFPGLMTEEIRPSTSGDPSQPRRVERLYDDQGNPADVVRSGVEDGEPFSYLTTTLFNAAGRPTDVDPPGYGTDDVTSWGYDPARGGLLADSRTDSVIGAVASTTFGYDALNRRTSVIDVNGVETVTEYDALDRIRFVRQKGETPAEDLVTEQRYDVFGDLELTILPRGNVLRYAYDAAGRLTDVERRPDLTTRAERTHYELDAAGNRTREDLQRWNGSGWETKSATGYVYETRCHLSKIVYPDGSVLEHAYDCNGNLEKLWDENHPSQNQAVPPSTEYVYDELDRLTEVIQPWGGAGGGTVTTSYGYDVQDHLTSVTDGEGNTTTWVYSDRDLLTSEVSPASGTTTHRYNEHGELVETADARGITAVRTVDALDRVESVDYPTGTRLDIDYVWDQGDFGLGRLSSIVRGGSSVDYAYDRFGRLVQDGELGYGYDENGNRARIDYPAGARAVYGHDFADRQTTLRLDPDADGPSPAMDVVTQARYLPSGPLEELDLANGVQEIRRYDQRYFPDEIRLAGAVDRLWDYAVDGVGNITEIVDTEGGGPAVTRSFGYQDHQYFLTSASGSPWQDLAWTYDRIGNRLSESRDSVVESYGYELNPSAGHTPILESVGPKSYDFDPAGNLDLVDAAGNLVDFTFDEAGRQSRVERPLADVGTSFEYDGRSYLRRAATDLVHQDGFESGGSDCWSAIVGGSGSGGECAEEPGRVTVPTYTTEGLLMALERRVGDESGRVDVLYFAGRPVGQWSTGEGEILRYLHTDHLGTPFLMTGAGGEVVWSGPLMPFGGDPAEAGPGSALKTGMFLRLPGQWDDEVWGNSSFGAGVHYNVHRWYSRSTGRYLSVDPLGWASRAPYHHYVAGNPLTKIDPLGLRVTSIEPDLLPFVECALEHGPQDFRVAFEYFDDPWWTGWRIRFQRPERLRAMDQIPRVPVGKRSESIPGSFPSRLFPGEFLIEPVIPGEDECVFYVQALMHEVIERHQKEITGEVHVAGHSQDNSSHRFAARFDDRAAKVCEACCSRP